MTNREVMRTRLPVCCRKGCDQKVANENMRVCEDCLKAIHARMSKSLFGD